jgi:hypothetical protein
METNNREWKLSDPESGRDMHDAKQYARTVSAIIRAFTVATGVAETPPRKSGRE